MHKDEQETHITFNAAYLMATIETYQPKIWRHLKRKELPNIKPKEITNRKGEIVGMVFRIPKNWIHIYKPRIWNKKQRKIVGNLLKKFRHSK